MARFVWTDEFELGIEVIDQQHRKIMDYANELDEALRSGQSRKATGKLIHTMVDFTLFHFAYEENLQEKAGYPYLKPHQKSHAAFTRRINDMSARFDAGEDVTKDIDSMLSLWVFDHLKHDDSDFVASVSEFLLQNPGFSTKKPGVFARLFK